MKCLQWGSAQAKRKVPNCILKMRARAAASCGTCLLFSLLLCCCLFSFSWAGGFVAVKVLRALVKWNSSGTLLDCSDSSLSNSIGLAKPNKCQQRLRFMTCPNVLSCDVAWFDTVSIPLLANETICHVFLNRRKVFVIEGRQEGRKLVAHNSLLGLLSFSRSLSLFLPLSICDMPTLQLFKCAASSRLPAAVYRGA